ncbi:MAG: acyl--CoA ligase, partial [Clostridia bacterium]|nr:acyl--CoA ligase [Clostridia bacterium]
MSMKKHQLHEKVEFANVRELVEWAANTYGEMNMFSYRRNPHDETPETVSFIRVRDDVRALAVRLAAMGCAGKHCAVIGKLSYDWALLYYALLSIGAVLVPLDPEWAPADLADTASTAEISFLFVEESIAEKAPAIAYACNLLADPIVFCTSDASAGLTPMLEAGRELFALSSDAYFNADIDPMAMALLVFTSGTTGKGKGV